MVMLYIRLGVPWTHLYYRIRVMVPRTTTFQLYRGCQFYWWRRPNYPEKNIELSQVTDNVTT